MKQTPRSNALFMIANDVFSSAPTLCMNDFSSASPKVIAPRQSSDTLTPDAPSFLYFMISSRPFEARWACGAEAYTPRVGQDAGPFPGARVPLPTGAKSGRVNRGGNRR